MVVQESTDHLNTNPAMAPQGKAKAVAGIRPPEDTGLVGKRQQSFFAQQDNDNPALKARLEVRTKNFVLCIVAAAIVPSAHRLTT